jgi:hypothetical protein
MLFSPDELVIKNVELFFSSSKPPGLIAVFLVVFALSTPGQGWGGGLLGACKNTPACTDVVSTRLKNKNYF